MASSKGRSKPKKTDNSGGFKFLFLVTAFVITGMYCWANFYVFYSARLPGNVSIRLKENPDWDYCVINLDNIFPDTQDEMQSLLLGVESLEKQPELMSIIEKHKLLPQLFTANLGAI